MVSRGCFRGVLRVSVGDLRDFWRIRNRHVRKGNVRSSQVGKEHVEKGQVGAGQVNLFCSLVCFGSIFYFNFFNLQFIPLNCFEPTIFLSEFLLHYKFFLPNIFT